MSAWNQIRCDERGIPMLVGETVQKQYPNFSLTIPKLKYGEIGVLTLTNLRLVFSVFQNNIAMEFKVTNIEQFSTVAHPLDPQALAFSKFKAVGGEEFSIQALRFDLADLSARLSTYQNAGAAAGATKVIKKISSKSSSSNTRGIAAAKQSEQNDINQKNAQLNSALADIQSLKESAQQLLSFAQELRSKGDSDSKNDLDEIYAALGVENTSIDKSDGQFTQNLALRFATDIKKVLEKKGGVLSVAEAFCIFNRLLVTDYVSPNDLADAIKHLQKREFGVKVETIEGVTVVILTDKVYSSVLKDILSKFSEDEYTTPLLMSKKTGLPLSIARNYLLHAESDGVLCRDDSMAGLRFYKNKFNSFKPMAY